MHKLEDGGSGSGSAPIEPSSEVRQRRRMLAALAMLLLALILIVVRNRQYLYPDVASSEPDSPAQTMPETKPEAPSAAANSAGASASQPGVPKPSSRSRVSTPVKRKAEPQISPAIATTERAVLPALQVEVVAGDKHHTVQAGSNSVNVEMQPGSAESDRLPSDADVAANSPTVNASERVRMSSDASGLVTHQVAPNYPLLAKQMKVQGAVILQALIGKEGKIQDLQVLSGPSILSSAAREAVKQWRFKPYYQSGEAVETQARITVNFTISTY